MSCRGGKYSLGYGQCSELALLFLVSSLSGSKCADYGDEWTPVVPHIHEIVNGELKSKLGLDVPLSLIVTNHIIFGACPITQPLSVGGYIIA